MINKLLDTSLSTSLLQKRFWRSQTSSSSWENIPTVQEKLNYWEEKPANESVWQVVSQRKEIFITQNRIKKKNDCLDQWRFLNPRFTQYESLFEGSGERPEWTLGYRNTGQSCSIWPDCACHTHQAPCFPHCPTNVSLSSLAIPMLGTFWSHFYSDILPNAPGDSNPLPCSLLPISGAPGDSSASVASAIDHVFSGPDTNHGTRQLWGPASLHHHTLHDQGLLLRHFLLCQCCHCCGNGYRLCSLPPWGHHPTNSD